MTDELRWQMLTRAKAENLIVDAFRIFREHNIEPILIKGWAAARNYPDGVPRYYGDIDLAVSADDYENAVRLAEDPGSGVKGVDLHRELRHLDTLDWERLYSNSQLVDVYGEAVRILSAEDHLRVLCVHWLTNGGEYRDRLHDIVYAVQNQPADFDWSKCLDVVSPSRRSWVVGTVGLAHKYLGLSLDGLPFADEARALPPWLTQCVERGWAADRHLRGLDESITDGKMFMDQIRKRVPPNPIQATIFCEGKFDETSRIKYQVRDMIGRLGPSIRRLSRALANQYRWVRSK